MSPTPERLPARPLRNWFLAWHIHTGDSTEVIAKGFDLDVEFVADLLSGDVPLMVDTQVAVHACLAIRVAPSAFWPSTSNWPIDGGGYFDCAWSEIPAPLVELFADCERRSRLAAHTSSVSSGDNPPDGSDAPSVCRCLSFESL